MAEAGTFETLLGEAGKALVPLQEALETPESFRALMMKLGWQADTIPQPLSDLAVGIDALYASLRKILGDGFAVSGSAGISDGTASASLAFSADDLGRLADALKRVVDGMRAIGSAPDAAFPPALIADGFKQKFPEQLLGYLLTRYLTTYHASVAFGLRTAGVVKAKYVPPTGSRLPYVHYHFDLSDLPTTLSSPRLVLQNAFGWGQPDFDVGALLSQLDNLLAAIGVDTFTEELPTATARKIEGNVDLPGDPRRKALKAVIFERSRTSGRMAADLRFKWLPADGAKKAGVAFMPAFNGLLDFRMELADDVAVTIRTDLDLAGGVALQIRPDEPIAMLVGFNGPGAATSARGSADVQVERAVLDGEPVLILGRGGGTRLQYRKIGGGGGIRLEAGSTIDVFAEVALKGLEFVFNPAEGDGFIAKIFPGDGIRFGTDLTVGVSHRDGFYFRGASHLEITVPAHVDLGLLKVKALTIAANPKVGALPISLGATVAADLGPLKASIENIGLTSTFSFPGSGGNLGLADLALAFKQPNGVGLSVDAGIVKGGGFLYYDKEREEYAGALELEFSGFLSLKAIGVITTRMPDGSKGFSLLIIITAEFGTGIQLGFGFTLLAVGGLLGLNRTMNLQALMDGVRTNSINSIMFPKDVVANAPRIISDLRTIFPPRNDTFLIGPMAKLGWGTPKLVQVSVGVIIEIPGNIAIIGVLRVAVPADDIPLIVLQVNFAGAIEFDKRRLYFFASLFESRVVFLTIDGELGLLVAYGDDANFVVTVGGFHPRFNPPPLPFPSPRRIAISLLDTPTSRLRIEGYFAVTSNTVQFGARVDVFFGLDELNVQGNLAFDALFQFSPFHFVIEISASLSVNVFGAGLFSVGIGGTLEGPSPWHVNGHGSISILFWDIDVDFETTWGESRDTQLPPIVVLPLLEDQFKQAGNWRALPPASSNLLVSLRRVQQDNGPLVLHPLGALRISQRALPLELKLDKVGNRAPSDVNRLTVGVGGSGLSKRGDAFEQFAPAQFQNFADADKLSKPAFAPEPGGLELVPSGADVRSSVMVKRVVRYEEVIIDSNFKRFQRHFFGFIFVLFDFFLGGAAVARSDLSKAAKTKLVPFDDAISVKQETYAVAFLSNKKAFGADSVAFHSESSANEFLQNTVAENVALAGSIQVIPTHELAA